METVHLQQQHLLMSSALDNFQKDSCCLEEVVHIWHTLWKLMYFFLIKMLHKKGIINVSHQYIWWFNLAHPKHKDEKLTQVLTRSQALEWLKNIDGDYVIPLMTLQISGNDYYPKSMFLPNVTDVSSPSKWWQIMAKKTEKATTPLNQKICNYPPVSKLSLCFVGPDSQYYSSSFFCGQTRPLKN